MNVLEINGLVKSFSGFTLGPLELTLPQGCIMGLVGENGAGKSTTIKLLLGMLHPTQGEMTILGRPGAAGPETREELGVVLDEVGLPRCMTVAQTGKVMARIFRRWEQETFESYVRRLDIPADKPFGELSRGNKMKAGIAVALSHRPRLLLLDEATSGLDPVVRDEVTDILSDFTRQEDHSVLLSSHIVSDLEKICDYVAFLHKGKLLLCQEKDRLLEEYGILRCTPQELSALAPEAVLHRKETSWGAEAIVRREAVPAGAAVSPVSIEELFIHMVKEAR